MAKTGFASLWTANGRLLFPVLLATVLTLAQAQIAPFSVCTTVTLKAPTAVVAGQEWGAAVAQTAGVLVVGSDGDRGGFVSASQEGLVALYSIKAAKDGRATLAQTLRADDGAVGNEFGSAVAINAAGILAVGAPKVARVYFYSVDTTTAKATLIGSKGTADQTTDLGYALAVDEADSSTGLSVVAVGVRLADTAATNAGSVILFRVNSTGIFSLHTLTAPDAAAGDEFGRATAMRDGLLAVGAPYDNDDGTLSGSVYLYRIAVSGTGAGAVQYVHKLTASDAAAGDRFGDAVAVSYERYVAVGAHREDEAGSNAGAVYIFEVAASGTGAGAVSEVEKLAGALDTDADDNFGTSVALEGNLLAIGAPARGTSGNERGAAYLYAINGTHALFQRQFDGPDGADDPRFGQAVALFDSSLVVGAPYRTSYTGAAYNYRCSSSTRMPLLFSTLDYANFDAAALDAAIMDAFDGCCGSADDDIYKLTFYPGSVVADIQFINSTEYSEALAAVEAGLTIFYLGSNYTAQLANVQPAGSTDEHDERGAFAGAVIGGLLFVTIVVGIAVIAVKQSKSGSNKIGTL